MRIVMNTLIDDIVDANTAALTAGRSIKRIYLTKHEEELLKEETDHMMIKDKKDQRDTPKGLIGTIDGVPIWKEEEVKGWI